MKNKTNVGIVFGGRSGEHEVSLQSAYNVICAIDRESYELTLIGITKEGVFKLYVGDTEKIKDGTWNEDEKDLISDFNIFSDPRIKKIDIFFPILHGTFGEDGTIQGMFEMMNVPYVGCSVLASAVAMDKDIAKKVFEGVGIPVVPCRVLSRSVLRETGENVANELEEMLSYPMFIKPANMGSSVGISKAHDRDALFRGLDEAFKYDDKVLIEQFIEGREIEVAVLGNKDIVASDAGEILPCHEFYDYEAKYLTSNASEVIIPSRLDAFEMEQIKKYAVRAFKAIGGTGLSRVDFFVTKDSKIYINEINTMPGFTNISMYPKLWDNMGLSYEDLITKLIDLGFDNYNNRKKLSFKKV